MLATSNIGAAIAPPPFIVKRSKSREFRYHAGYAQIAQQMLVERGGVPGALELKLEKPDRGGHGGILHDGKMMTSWHGGSEQSLKPPFIWR